MSRGVLRSALWATLATGLLMTFAAIAQAIGAA